MRNFLAQCAEIRKEHQVLRLMLLLGIFFGLVFIFIVSPWQHYDEPTQFEFAWLIANRPGLPERGEFDQSMRRELAASMIEHQFFRGMGFKPNLASIAEPIWIGITQAGSKPLYYFLTSIPLRVIQTADVTLQLFTLRLFSLLFFLTTIVSAYGIAVELTPKKHPLRWLLPLSVLMLPSLVDIMTAVNDDVGATAFFSLFLWAGIRLINRGFNWLRFGVFLLLSVISFYTKTTVAISLGLVLVPLLFSVVRDARRRFIWIGFGAVLVPLIFILFAWGDAAYWYRVSPQNKPTKTTNHHAPIGENVFKLSLAPGIPNPEVVQVVSLAKGSSLRSDTYSVGAWMWADQPAAIRSPILEANNEEYSKVIDGSKEPIFVSFTETVDPTDPNLKVVLAPTKKKVDEALTVYYDGIVMVEGSFPEGSEPIFDDANGLGGVWAGERFTNLLRNPSAESSWPRIRSWVESSIVKNFPGNPSLVLSLLLDPAQVSYYYRATFKLLAQSFWARFGWGHVVLQGYYPYTILGAVTLAGILGAVFAFWRNRKTVRWEIVFFLGVSMVIVWGAAFLRGLTSTIDGPVFIPVARYAFPVVIPTMLVLNIGWLEIVGWIESKLKVPRKILYGFLIGFFVLLDILSVYSIYQFYNS